MSAAFRFPEFLGSILNRSVVNPLGKTAPGAYKRLWSYPGRLLKTFFKNNFGRIKKGCTFATRFAEVAERREPPEGGARREAQQTGSRRGEAAGRGRSVKEFIEIL